MGIDAEWDARTQLVQAWMLLADGKTATAHRMFASMPGQFRPGSAWPSPPWPVAGSVRPRGCSPRPNCSARQEDLALRAPAIARRAVCLARMGQAQYAAHLCESALNEVTDRVARLWLCRAGVRVFSGERRAASAHEALARAESIDFRKSADIYHQLGTTLRRCGADGEAASMLDRAIELLARTSCTRAWASKCHLVRARELGAAGAIAEAIDHAHRAVPWVRAQALCELADLYRHARRYDEARRFANQAQDASSGLGDAARAQRVLGLIAADCAPERAEPLLRQAAHTYAQAGEKLEVAETMRMLGLFLDRIASRLTRSPRNGTPSAFNRRRASFSWPGTRRPPAPTTPCHGTAPPCLAMIVPTWRAELRPDTSDRASAIAP